MKRTEEVRGGVDEAEERREGATGGGGQAEDGEDRRDTGRLEKDVEERGGLGGAGGGVKTEVEERKEGGVREEAEEEEEAQGGGEEGEEEEEELQGGAGGENTPEGRETAVSVSKIVTINKKSTEKKSTLTCLSLVIIITLISQWESRMQSHCYQAPSPVITVIQCQRSSEHGDD